MTAKLIDGKILAAALRERVGEAVKKLKQNQGIVPGLAVVLVGDDAASAIYVRNKEKAAKEAGMESFEVRLPENTGEDELVAKIDALKKDSAVHGILVQFPVPPHISQKKILDLLDFSKDIDGLTPHNVGRLAAGEAEAALLPCTPQGILLLAKHALGEDLAGAHAVVIGRSNLVGKPVAQLLLQENCTVTIAHSRTQDLPSICRTADILVAAAGIPELVKADWVKRGACVIDVGINRLQEADKKPRIVGDVDFAAVSKVAGFLTPVPGGVGPMTVACLLKNTFLAACRIHGINAELLEQEYDVEPIGERFPHKLLLIKTKHETVSGRGSLYEAVRYSWRISRQRAEQAEYVLAVIEGVCYGVFRAEEWILADDKRWDFKGKEVEDPKILKLYLNKRVPEKFRRQRYPIGYINC